LVVASDYPFWTVFWNIIELMFVFMFIWMFIALFADVFRRHDLGGIQKAVWIFILFVVPFLGALVYIIVRPKPTEEDVQVFGQARARQGSAAGYSSADEIAKLAQLRDSGTISSEEFEAAKARALG
jgi:hypothetical protein